VTAKARVTGLDRGVILMIVGAIGLVASTIVFAMVVVRLMAVSTLTTDKQSTHKSLASWCTKKCIVGAGGSSLPGSFEAMGSLRRDHSGRPTSYGVTPRTTMKVAHDGCKGGSGEGTGEEAVGRSSATRTSNPKSRADRGAGEVKEKVGKTEDLAEGAIDKAKDKVKEVIDESGR